MAVEDTSVVAVVGLVLVLVALVEADVSTVVSIAVAVMDGVEGGGVEDHWFSHSS